MAIVSVNPADGNTLQDFAELSAAEIERALALAEETFRSWRRTAFANRAAKMLRAAEILEEDKRRFGEIMTLEMGKPIAAAVAEVEKCAWVCRYYAEHAETFLAPQEIATDAGRSYVRYDPLGPVLAVMPWNFPFWQVLRFAMPALVGGNGALLKHAPTVPGCALALERLLRDAGFPEGLFRTLLISVSQVKSVIRHRHVAAVSLTGSTAAGKAVAREAGSRLKKCVLELGGSDPYVVLEDADLDMAVEACATSRLINSGQSCIAAKRFLVVEQLRAEFTRRLVERLQRVSVGDPMAPGTEVGPLARADLRDRLHDQVQRSVAAGARVLLGGALPAGPGFFYPVTVLADVAKGMPAYAEELFGPVAAIIPVRDGRAALKVANDTTYGLGAAVFTEDLERGERIAADELEAGSCFVNAFVRSDPRLPFGGTRESGYGRELGRHGLLEFQNAKTVYIR